MYLALLPLPSLSPLSPATSFPFFNSLCSVTLCGRITKAMPTRRPTAAQHRQQQDQHDSTQLSVSSSYQAADEAIRRTDQYITELSSLHRSVPPVVTFCVDGRTFAVSRDVLLKDPQSLLFVLANAHYSQAPQTAARTHGTGQKHGHSPEMSAVVIPNRDPQVFAMLLNVLRGYQHAVPEACMDACREDAAFYGLERSWHALYGATPSYQFRTTISSSKLNSEAVCAVASEYFTTGRHTIDLLVSQCDRVGVGVIMEGIDLEDRDALRAGFGCALYWNDGKVSTNFGAFQMAETGKPFKSAALIQITLDADEAIVSWMLADEWRVASLKLPPQKGFAFAAMASRTSQVNIVPSN